MPNDRSPLRDVCAVFLKLGCTAFGGPLAHIAAMEDEVVTRRGWLTRSEFADLLSVANLLPGPNSTELALEIGMRRAGWRGMLAAGACFILPAVLCVWVLALGYVQGTGLHGHAASVPTFRRIIPALLAGMQPVVLAVVVQAAWRLGRTVIGAWHSALIAALALGAILLGVNELVVLGAAAIVGAAVNGAFRARFPVLVPATLTAVASGAASVSIAGVFGSFLKIGGLLFGSGYVLLSFMRVEFVERHHWLSEAELLDAIAAGQVTPGPLFSSATFVGYLLAGNWGAIAATAGIFLPAFVFVAASAPLVRWLRTEPALRSALDALNAASLALLVSAAFASAAYVARSPASVVLFCGALVLLFLARIPSAWLLLGGALFGALTLRFPFLVG